MAEPHIYWTCPMIVGVVEGFKEIDVARKKFYCASCRHECNGPKKYRFPDWLKSLKIGEQEYFCFCCGTRNLKGCDGFGDVPVSEWVEGANICRSCLKEKINKLKKEIFEIENRKDEQEDELLKFEYLLQNANGDIQKFSILCLCGSDRFKDDFERIRKDWTLEGYIVISLEYFEDTDNDPTILERKEMLNYMRLKKIDMADAIYVINKDGYINDSTRREIEYAKKKSKNMIFMNWDDITFDYNKHIIDYEEIAHIVSKKLLKKKGGA